MRNLKKINSISEIVEQEYGVCYKTANDVYVKQSKKKPNIVLYYNDGTKQEYPDATEMTWDLINGKTSEYDSNTTLVKAELNDGVTSIGEAAFKECSSLTSVTMSNSVTSIGAEAFRMCESLTTINIPDSVTTIGYSVFKSCTSLTSVNIPNSITTILTSTFGDCPNLTSVTIPDSVTTISDNVFNGCSSLTTITIPNSVTSIGGYLFFECFSLTSVTYNGTIAQWNAIPKDTDWKNGAPSACLVHFIDGDIHIVDA